MAVTRELWHSVRVPSTTALLGLLLTAAVSTQIVPAPSDPAPSIAATALPTSTSANSVAPSSATAQPNTEAGFANWLVGFRKQAISDGLPPSAVDAVAAGLRYDPRVVELDRAQPDDSAWQPSVFSSYLDKHLTPAQVTRGRAVAADLGPALASISAKTGVPSGVILGIWGMESNYGAVTGSFDVPRALASLAYDGRRRALFTRELEAAIRIVADGRAARAQLKGSWAGAMGQPQFLPSSFLAHAADGNGDGRADIWTSRADVAASIAAYLRDAGWVRGQRWGMRVTVPAGFGRELVRDPVVPATCVRPMSKHSRWLSLAAWRALGIKAAAGAIWPADDTLQATLIEPDGAGTAAYLTFGNYRALLDYNCSNFYALSVALLGDALDGAQ